WNNLDDGKLLGSGIISGAVRYDKTPPEITEVALTSTNPGENVEDFSQENKEHTRLVRDNDTLFLEFITNEQIRLNPQVEFLTDNGNFHASKIENLVYGTTWDSNTSWKAELKIGDHVEILDDREGFFGFKITIHDLAGNERIVEFADDGTNLVQSLPLETSTPTKNCLAPISNECSIDEGFRARYDLKKPEIMSISVESSNSGTNLDYPETLLVRHQDTLTVSFETSERISVQSDLDGALKPMVSFYHNDKPLPVSDEFIKNITSDTTGTIWKAELTIDENSEILNDKEEYLGFKIIVFDKAGNQREISFNDNGTELSQNIISDEDSAENLTKKRVRFDTVLPNILHFSFSSTNQGLNSEDYPQTLLAKDGDNITLSFQTSERIDNDSIFPEVIFLNGNEQENAEQSSIIHTDNGTNWTATLDASKLPANKENFLGFRIIVYDEAGNKRTLEFLDDNTSLIQLNPPLDDFVTVNHSGYRMRFDRKAPEIESIAWLSSNLGENVEDFPSTRLVRNGDNLSLSFHTSERISLKTDLEGSRKPYVSFFSKNGELPVTDANILLQTSDDGGTRWHAILPIVQSISSLQNDEGYLGFKITVSDKVGNQRVVEFTDDGTYGEEFDAGLTQKDLEGDNDFITLNPSNFRARFDTKLPEIESINLLSSNPGTNPDYNNDESNSLLLRDNDTVSLEFVTSERISTSSDLSGNRKPEIHFIAGDTELKVDNNDIKLQIDDSSGRKWVAHLKIDESVSSLTDNETYLGFKVKVLDKSGNERTIQFNDDGTSLTQVLPETPVTQTSNTSGNRALVDTKRPEIIEFALTSSNEGVNLDYPDSRMVRDGDTLTLSFKTTERISTKDDLEGDLEGSRKPNVSFFFGNEELPVDVNNITKQFGHQGETKWQAELEIDGTLSHLKDKEGYLGFKISVLDKAGNERQVEFVDDETNLTQQTLEGEGDYSTLNPSAYRARIDTKLPDVIELAFHSTNTGVNSEDFPNTIFARDNDTIHFSFKTSEEVDNQTDRYPEVRFLDGDSEFVAKTGSVVSTGDGKNWEAKLDASDLPDDKENFLGVRIIVYDEVGNKNDITISEAQIRDNATLNPLPSYRLRFDKLTPVLDNLSLASTNLGILDQDRLSHVIAKAGDKLTLFFRTSERIASPDDGVLAPSLVIKDEDGDFLANTILTPQISDDNETLWQAQFQVPVDDINFNDLETDLAFHISVKDPSGNERILEFDHESTLIDPTGTQTTQAPSNGARIDTKSPEVEFVSLKTSNQGLPDQDRLTHLLAKEGDNLTLYFTTSERIAGVDETSTNTPLKPIVEFKAGTDKVFEAMVTRTYFNDPLPTTKQLQSNYCSNSKISCSPKIRSNY
ncbi:MAG: Ig-like domain repeat protein, partial [Actinomycetota bacterium]|nr:Ig-like domain repeat protein [Actinomycetota bacterium]